MRVSIAPDFGMQGLRYALRIGESTICLRSSAGGWSYSEWTGTWIDGRSMQVRLPNFSAFATPRWGILLNDEPICDGTLEAGFLSGYRVAWTYRDASLQCRSRYRLNGGVSLRTEEGFLLAAWRFRRCSMHGVLRSSASSEQAAAAVGIAFSMLVVKDDSP